MNVILRISLLLLGLILVLHYAEISFYVSYSWSMWFSWPSYITSSTKLKKLTSFLKKKYFSDFFYFFLACKILWYNPSPSVWLPGQMCFEQFFIFYKVVFCPKIDCISANYWGRKREKECKRNLGIYMQLL